MKTLKPIIVIASMTFLTACAQMNPMITGDSGVNREDYAVLAKHYGNSAMQAKQKLAEYEQSLARYEINPPHAYYGRRMPDIQSRATANIRGYNREIRESKELAYFYTKLAAEQMAKENGVVEKEVHLESIDESTM